MNINIKLNENPTDFLETIENVNNTLFSRFRKQYVPRYVIKKIDGVVVLNCKIKKQTLNIELDVLDMATNCLYINGVKYKYEVL